MGDNSKNFDFYKITSEIQEKLDKSNLLVLSKEKYNKKISEIINNYFIEKQKELVLNHCGISILKIFDKDLSEYNFELKEILEKEGILKYDDFIKKYKINKENFKNLKKENVGENPLEEIYKTYKFLYSKFYESKKDLEKIGINFDAFLEAIINRLIEQIKEAGNSERILKNGIVVGLSKITNDGFEFIKVPYYAFSSTNVSLDKVKLKDKNGETLTLRKIDTKLNSKNSKGEFFLPNSLGVSASLMTTNKSGKIVLVSQERNNAKVLTQNTNNFIASASGGVPINILKEKNPISTIMNQEIKEELGSISHQLSNKIINNNTGIFGLKDLLDKSLKSRLQKEIGDTKINNGLIGIALVMQEARRNPEIIFIANSNNTIEEIQKKWEKAEDKDESLSIRGFTLKEIYTDLENREKGKEIKIDNHFFMSFLGYLIKSRK